MSETEHDEGLENGSSTRDGTNVTNGGETMCGESGTKDDATRSVAAKIADQIEQARKSTDDAEVRYHVRQAQQLLDVLAER